MDISGVRTAFDLKPGMKSCECKVEDVPSALGNRKVLKFSLRTTTTSPDVSEALLVELAITGKLEDIETLIGLDALPSILNSLRLMQSLDQTT